MKNHICCTIVTTVKLSHLTLEFFPDVDNENNKLHIQIVEPINILHPGPQVDISKND
jgi:hypothetical protein